MVLLLKILLIDFIKENRFVLFCVLLASSLLFNSCYSTPTKEKIFPSNLLDYPHKDTLNLRFYNADSLKLEKAYEESNEVFIKILNDSSICLSERLYCLNQLSYNYLWLNKDEFAQKYVEEIEEININNIVSQNEILADYHFNKGWLYSKKRWGKETFNHLFKAQKLYASIYPPGHKKNIEVNCELGFAYREFSTKLDSCIHYMDVVEQLLFKDSILLSSMIKPYIGMAISGLFKRNHYKGLSAINLALIQANKFIKYDTMLLGRLHSIKGDIYRKLENYEESIIEHDKAIAYGESKKGNNERLQEFYRNRLILHIYEQDSSAFFSFFDKLELAFPEQSLTYANKDRLLGKYFEVTGAYRKAINYNKKAIDFYEKLDYPDELFFGRARYSLNWSYQQLGIYDSAVYYMQYDILARAPLHADIVDLQAFMNQSLSANQVNFYTLGEIASCYVKAGRKYPINKKYLTNALLIFEKIDSVMYGFASTENSVQLVFQKELVNRIYSNAIEAALLLYDAQNQISYLDLANKYTDRLKSTILYRDMWNGKKDSSKLLSKKRALKARIDQLQSTNELNVSKQIDLLKYQSELHNVAKEIEEQHPAYYKQRIQQIIPTYNQIRPYLKKQKASILQYHFNDRFWCVLAMTPDTFVYYRNQLPHNHKDVLMAYQQAIREPFLFADLSKKKLFCQNAYAIYHQFIQPVTPFLTSNVFTIQDASFGGYPIGSLLYQPVNNPANTELPYLIHKYEITYAFSLKNLMDNFLEPSQLSKKSKIAAYSFSGSSLPKFPVKRGSSYNELFYSQEEVETISKIWGREKVQTISGQASTKTHFLNSLNKKKWDIIHLALHAQSDNATLNNNRIIFRHQKYRDSIENLYGFEIANLKINIPLAILSACQTAIGVNQEGEGVYSLARDFKQAGVKQIISTLWEVDDYVTHQLMIQLHHYLHDGSNEASALAKVKRKYLVHAHENLSAPYFWGGIILLL